MLHVLTFAGSMLPRMRPSGGTSALKALALTRPQIISEALAPPSRLITKSSLLLACIYFVYIQETMVLGMLALNSCFCFLFVLLVVSNHDVLTPTDVCSLPNSEVTPDPWARQTTVFIYVCCNSFRLNITKRFI